MSVRKLLFRRTGPFEVIDAETGERIGQGKRDELLRVTKANAVLHVAQGQSTLIVEVDELGRELRLWPYYCERSGPNAAAR